MISIILPNYNGRELLEQNLPSLLEAAKRIKCEIIVVDDFSSDSSREFLRENYPGIRLLCHDANHGFGKACNTGAHNSSYDIIYLLNTDVRPEPGFLEPLLEHFSDPDVFAASSLERQNSAGNDSVKDFIAMVKFKFGILWYWYEPFYFSQERAVEIFVASGGHTAYSKSKFLELGGFDRLFRPFYAEDGDISWRAWKRGWKTILEPRSIVFHKPQSTIGKYSSRKEILRIHWKNRFLMTWKNLTSGRLLFKHIFFTIPGIAVCPFIGKKEFSIGFFLAAKNFRELLRARKKSHLDREVYTDVQLFARFSKKDNY